MKKSCLLTIALLAMGSLVGCGGKDNPPTPPHAHDFSGSWKTDEHDHWKECTAGDGVKGQLAEHSFESKGVTPATCEHCAIEKFECSVCHYQKFVEVGNELKDHQYSVELTKVATCSTKGEYTFTCDVCHKSYTQEYSDPDAHKLSDGVTVDGITRFDCEYCDYFKTVIDHSDKEVAEVATEDLKTAGEVSLQNASIQFEESALENLGENVEIKAETKTVEEIENISEEVKEAIGEGTIVDFSLKDGEDQVTNFNGTLTITIPYTLKEGEDPNGIVVWYIDEFGQTESISATYRDGNAIFETTHFSIYCVIHMSPEELCKTFGHRYLLATHAESTCSVHGYEDYVCTRCHETAREVLPLVAHEYEFFAKKDSTTTEEGYIEYKCKHCDDSYRTIIEKKTGNNAGFYLNMISTAAANDLHIEGVQVSDEFESLLDMYIGEDKQGIPYTYQNADGDENVIYKGYSYSSRYLDKYNNSSSTTMLMVKGSLSTIFDALPPELVAKIDELSPWLEKNIINKEAVPEGFNISINKAGVVALVNVLETKSLGEAIDIILGEGTVDTLLSLIDFVYDEKTTVKGALDKVKEFLGVGVDVIYCSLIKVLKQLGIAPQTMPDDFYELLPDGMLETKLINVLGQLVPELPDLATIKAYAEQFLAMNLFDIIDMFSHFSSGGSGGNIDVKPSHDYEEPHEVVPEKAGEASQTPITDTVRSYLEMLDVTITVDSEGRFMNAKFSMEDFQVGYGRTMSMEINVQKGFDSEPILERVLALVAKCEKKEGIFDLNANNYEWLGNAYQEQFEGVEFDWIEEYMPNPYSYDYKDDEYNYYYSALVSKGKVRYSFFDDDAYKRALEEYLNHPSADDGQMKPEPTREDFYYDGEGKLTLLIEDAKSYVQTVRNPGGYGSLLAKDEYGFITSSSQYVRNAVFTYMKDGIEYNHIINNYSYYEEEGLHSYQFLYVLSSDKVYSTTGSFSYLDSISHNYQYSVVSKKEFVANTGYDPDDGYIDLGYKRIFYRVSCSDCGEVYYSYSHMRNTSFEYTQELNYFNLLDTRMNDDALEFSEYFRIDVNYRSNGTFEYNPYFVNEYSINRSPAGATTLELRKDSALTKYLQADGTLKIGNVVLSAKINSTSGCSVNIGWSVSIDGETLKSGVYSLHSGYYDYNHRVEQKLQLTKCEYIVFEGYKCEECGKTYYFGYHHEYEHNYVKGDEPIASADKTELTPGYEVYEYTCSHCGQTHYSIEWDYPCAHNLVYRDGAWVCVDCGFSIQGSEDEKPLGLIEEFEGEDIPDYYMAYVFKFYGEHYPYDYSTFWNYNMYCFTVAYVTDPETGEQTMVTYTDPETGEEVPCFYGSCYLGYNNVYYPVYVGDNYYGSYEVYYLFVYEDDYYDMLQEAERNYIESYNETHPEEEWISTLPENVTLYGAIIIVSNSGEATTFMFVLN